MDKIIGRQKQIAEIHKLYESGQSELLAVYGRRRVGKTFLIDESLKGRITFRHAGLSPIEGTKRNNLKSQLKHFYLSLKLQGSVATKAPQSWLDAFFLLEQLLESKDDGSRQVVFLDELPWLDTPRSGFLTAFEGFWNNWGCHRDNFMLVVCGSANSWVLDNLINSHGGLYGRTTCEMHLTPFNLHECKEFFESRRVSFSDYDIVQAYMVLGGIPYYLRYINREQSLSQNIDNLFWSRSARLRDEFERLFDSAFDSPDDIKKIVKFIAKKHIGFTRKEIAEGLGHSDGGVLTKRLRALVASDFITEYIPFGMSKRELHYRLSDPFCNFYLRFVEGNRHDEDFWSANINSQSIISWRGIAFEEVCLNHIYQIKTALGINGVASHNSPWAVQGDAEHRGAQIDLLIDRRDNVVNMCEMKFYSDEFVVDKDYEMTIRHRTETLRERLPKRYAVHPTIITTFGVKRNMYSDIFLRQLTLECLFTPDKSE